MTFIFTRCALAPASREGDSHHIAVDRSSSHILPRGSTEVGGMDRKRWLLPVSKDESFSNTLDLFWHLLCGMSTCLTELSISHCDSGMSCSVFGCLIRTSACYLSVYLPGWSCPVYRRLPFIYYYYDDIIISLPTGVPPHLLYQLLFVAVLIFFLKKKSVTKSNLLKSLFALWLQRGSPW